MNLFLQWFCSLYSHISLDLKIVTINSLVLLQNLSLVSQ